MRYDFSSMRRGCVGLENLKDKKLFIFDIEGVLCSDIDDPHVNPGASSLLSDLRARGKRIHVISNVSRKSRRVIVDSLNRLDLCLEEEDVSTAASTAASYVSRRLPQARCFLLSEGGLVEEFVAKGLAVVDEAPVDVVVIGADRTLTYRRLNDAMRFVRKGAELVCAGPGVVFLGTFGEDRGYFIGGGAICEAVRLASGVAPHYVGKPYPEIFQEALRRWDVQAGDAVMVGDNYGSDVEGAKSLGMASVLVYEGGSLKQSDLMERYCPDLVVRDLVELSQVLA